MLSRFSRVRLFATPWTVAHQTPLSRQEYWRGLPCPPPGDLPNSGIEPGSPMSPALAGGFFTTSASWKAWRHGFSGPQFFLAVKWDHSDTHLVGPSKESVGRRPARARRRPSTRTVVADAGRGGRVPVLRSTVHRTAPGWAQPRARWPCFQAVRGHSFPLANSHHQLARLRGHGHVPPSPADILPSEIASGLRPA